MSEEKTPLRIFSGSFETKEVPTVYCNQANVSLSFNDVRVYVAEVAPTEITVGPLTKDLVQKEPMYHPRVCLVFSPEFARSFAKAVMVGTERYEAMFGPLRPEPSAAQLGETKEKS
jgi:hypothetical protein